MSLINKKIYQNYAENRNWDKAFFTFDAQEADFYSKELKEFVLSGVQLLDIGFGKGSLLAWAQQQGAVISGVEIQQSLLDAANSKGIPIFQDLESIPSNQFDVITVFDVLEHIPYAEIPCFLNEVMRIMKPGGIVLLRFPNCQSAAGLVVQFGDPTHLSMLSGPIVENYLNKVGYKCIEYREARDIESVKRHRRFLKKLLFPFRYLFKFGYKLTFSSLSTPLSFNILIKAKKDDK